MLVKIGITNLKNKFGIQKTVESDGNDMLSSDSDESKNEIDISDNINSSQNDDRCLFELDIPYETYCKMKPVTVEYGKNKKIYTVLKQGVWSNIVFDEFLKKFKLSCCFAFKRCKVFSLTADHFLKMYAN